jgi:Ni,Fe-hydrogenase III large subunit
MMLRADEIECSLSLIRALVRRRYYGNICMEAGEIPPYSFALGYTESPRGSLFYWVKSDQDGKPSRVKLRSPSYCNWPAVPFAIPGNIVPDFPLCNKSFNLSYSGCDM